MTHNNSDNTITTADTKAHDYVPVIPLSEFVEQQYRKLGETDTGIALYALSTFVKDIYFKSKIRHKSISFIF